MIERAEAAATGAERWQPLRRLEKLHLPNKDSSVVVCSDRVVNGCVSNNMHFIVVLVEKRET